MLAYQVENRENKNFVMYRDRSNFQGKRVRRDDCTFQLWVMAIDSNLQLALMVVYTAHLSLLMALRKKVAYHVVCLSPILVSAGCLLAMVATKFTVLEKPLVMI